MSAVRWFLRKTTKGVRLLTEHTKVSISHHVEWISEQSRVILEATIHHQRKNGKREDNYDYEDNRTYCKVAKIG